MPGWREGSGGWKDDDVAESTCPGGGRTVLHPSSTSHQVCVSVSHLHGRYLSPSTAVRGGIAELS